MKAINVCLMTCNCVISCHRNDEYVSGSSKYWKYKCENFKSLLNHFKKWKPEKLLEFWPYIKISTKINKKYAVIFANFNCLYFNYCIDISGILQVFKQANIITVYKKKNVIKLIKHLSVHYQAVLSQPVCFPHRLSLARLTIFESSQS